MPLKTFHNLSEARRRQIIDAGLEEFARHGYRGASLSRIISGLGLAKGSFYRYFESKRSLYAYLIEYAAEANFEIYQDVFSRPVEDILDAWIEFYLTCVRQDNSRPLLGYFGYRLALDRNDPVLGDVPRAALRKGTEFLRDLFRSHQREGRIRSDLDAEFLIFVLLKLQSGFMEYLSLKHGIDFDDGLQRGRPLFPLPEEVVKDELARFAEVLRHGIRPRSPSLQGGDHDIR